MTNAIETLESTNRTVLVRTAVSTVCALFVGAVLAISGFAHASNPVYFLGSIVQYGIFPSTLARWIGATLPWIEIGLASMLLLSLNRHYAFIASALLAICFVGMQSWALLRGLKIDCGCFGSLTSHPIGAFSYSIAVGLGGLSLVGLFGLPQIEKEL